MDRSACCEEFDKNGFMVIEDLLRPEECDELVQAAYELSLSLQDNNKTVFSTKEEKQLNTDYFLESNDKIRPFFEDRALDEAGNIIVDPRLSLNKIGHALHYLHPLYRCYTFCDRMKTVVKNMGFVEPAVVQSMVIFKNPGVSSEVQPHQDATYLFSEPTPPVGFWIALEDATIDNGCLWILSGSHKTGIHRRLVRNPDPNGAEKLIYVKSPPTYPSSGFKPVPVKKGSCIILHGHVVHKSGVNRTDNPRPAYTFHVIEKNNNVFSADNWIQEGPAAPFENMFTVTQIILPESETQEQSGTSAAEPSTNELGPATSQVAA